MSHKKAVPILGNGLGRVSSQFLFDAVVTLSCWGIALEERMPNLWKQSHRDRGRRYNRNTILGPLSLSPGFSGSIFLFGFSIDEFQDGSRR